MRYRVYRVHCAVGAHDVLLRNHFWSPYEFLIARHYIQARRTRDRFNQISRSKVGVLCQSPPNLFPIAPMSHSGLRVLPPCGRRPFSTRPLPNPNRQHHHIIHRAMDSLDHPLQSPHAPNRHDTRRRCARPYCVDHKFRPLATKWPRSVAAGTSPPIIGRDLGRWLVCGR